ncbi:MAG: hypothetical protein Q9222_002630 [Ikaeria aurantiellina]
MVRYHYRQNVDGDPDDDEDELDDEMCQEVISRVKTGLSNGTDAQKQDSSCLALNTLTLKALCASGLPTGKESVFCWHNLTSLSIQSCWELEEFFIGLMAENEGLPRISAFKLRSFSIRHEISDDNLKEQLEQFRVSLPALTKLSVLLEPVNQFLDIERVLERHGPTLRSLVWHERNKTRLEDHVFEQRWKLIWSNYVTAIAERCPNLVELGIPLNWNSFMHWEDSNYGLSISALRSLRNLQTINIRNLPRLRFQVKEAWFPPEQMFMGVADILIKSLLGAGDYSTTIPLDTLVIGSLTYRDLRNGLGMRNIHDYYGYKYRQPHIFQVGRHRQFQGRPKPLATLLEVGTHEKTEAAGGNVECLKPYWLH